MTSARVAALAREERLHEAAALASAEGDHGTARQLYERACAFGLAAREALAGHDPGEALVLAAQAGDTQLAEIALAALEERGDEGRRVALRLEQRGHVAWAARLYDALGQLRDAARAYDKAGDAIRAAKLLERASDVVAAAKTLEAAMRRAPDDHALALSYGALLLRYGKVEHSTRALQRVPEGSPHRRAALTLLVNALGALGLAQAADEAARELASLGGPLEEAAPEPARAEVKARLFGRYEVVREVASSPSARVVECMDAVRGEHVAVKIFAGADAHGAGRDALARFEREVRVLGSLDHSNVVPLRDYLPEGPALVVAWMSGGTLEDMLKRQPITPARAVEIAVAVLSALGEAHRVGVLHRDVKPANVLFDDAGVTRLGDFGAAHLGDLSATATAGIIGTLAYMSPEQREGRPATVQSDLYGVGALLWEMLTGERPGAVDGQPGRASPSALHRDLDGRHDRVVERLLAASPQDRPGDAFAARRELLALPWPDTLERAAQKKGPSIAPAAPARAATRAIVRGDGVLVDSWLDRPIERVPLDDVTLARAKVLARLDHPLLQGVLRVDHDDRSIWLENPDTRPLGRRLTLAELEGLRGALTLLHREGFVHGSVDAAHVRERPDGSVWLRFAPTQGPTATADNDLLALARLGA